MRSSLTCLLSGEGRPFGLLFFTSRHPDAYRGARVEFFTRLAGELFLVIERSRSTQRLLQMNETLGLAVHDLRSPVTLIKVCVGALLRVGELSETQREIPDEVDHATHSMKLLIDDLLDLSLLGAERLKISRLRVELGRFLQGCYGSCRPVFPAWSWTPSECARWSTIW